MDNAKVVERIVKGLTQKPAYLLAFGVFFLLLGGGLAAALVSKAIASSALILAGIALVALIVVIFIVEREGRGAPVGRTGDSDFDPILDAIYQQLRSALGRSHPVFRDRMKRECEQFRAVTSLWASGQLRTTQRVYNEMLLAAYERQRDQSSQLVPLTTSPPGRGF